MAYDTVVFLGENGTGKTSILSSLSGFLYGISLQPFEYIEYESDGEIYRAEPFPQNVGNPCFHKCLTLSTGEIEEIRRDNCNAVNVLRTDTKDARFYGCVFSKARSDYKADPIKSSSTKKLDAEKHDNDKDDDFTSLKQLLVDVYQKDANDFLEANKTGHLEYSEFERT